MVNLTLWSVVIVAVAFAIYYRLFMVGKKLCKVTIYERNGDVLVQHLKTYVGFEKVISNETKTKKIRWLRINGLNKDWLLPYNKHYIHSTKGLKNLHLIWHGGNNFQLLKLRSTSYNYDPIKSKLGETYYKRTAVITHELLPINEDMGYQISQLEDTLDKVYQHQKSLLEKLQPYYALGIIVLVAIAAMYITGKQNTEASQSNSMTAKFLVNAIEGISTKKIDDNTVIKTDVTKGVP